MKRPIVKRRIRTHLKLKTSPELRETIVVALKSPAWHQIAKIVSGPTRQQSALNLHEIDAQTTPGDTVVIPGKVLAEGELTKKLRICALSISLPAKEKLKKTKSEFVPLLQEINKNSKAEGVKILR